MRSTRGAGAAKIQPSNASVGTVRRGGPSRGSVNRKQAPCPALRSMSSLPERRLPVVEAAARELLSLPMSPTLTRGDVDEVVAALADVLDELDMPARRAA